MSREIARVGDLCEQIRGVTYSKGEASSVPSNGLAPVLRANNITEFGLSFDDLVYVPTARIRPNQRVRLNDIIIAASSGSLDVVGKAARALHDFDGGFGAFCKVLRPNSNVDPGYFAQFFQTPKYRRTVSALAAGANINNLRNEHLDELKIPLPPLPEQRRIAAILDKAEALRAKRRQAIAKLDQLLQSVFLEMFGDPVTNSKGWPVRKIGDLLESVKYGSSDKATLSGEVPILRMNNLTYSGEMDLSDLKYITHEQASDKYLVEPGDLLFNRTNSKELVGKTAVYDGPVPMAYAGYLVRGRVKQGVAPEYVSAFLNSKYGKTILRGMCKNIVGMANINAKEFASIAIPAPPDAQQAQFQKVVVNIRKRKLRMKAMEAQQDRLFESVQQRAFSGRL